MRNHYFDNLKFILIFLVVLGHFLERYRADCEWMNGLYLFIYLFHMPLFALVSGYFSKKYSPRIKDISFVVIPFLLFQVAYIAYYHALGLKGPEWEHGWNMAVPFVQNWYLLSLLGWRFLSLAVRKIKLILPISFAAALLIGYVPWVGWELSLSRTICFFPFFLLGIKANPVSVDVLRRFRKFAIPVLGGLLLMGLILGLRMPNRANLVIWNSFYAAGYELPDAAVSGPIYRVGVYLLSLISGAAVMMLIPIKEMWFSKLGERTMTIFLLHNFLVFGLKKIHPDYTLIATELWVFGGAIGTTFLLSLQYVDAAFRYPFTAINTALERLFINKPRSK